MHLAPLLLLLLKLTLPYATYDASRDRIEVVAILGSGIALTIFAIYFETEQLRSTLA